MKSIVCQSQSAGVTHAFGRKLGEQLAQGGTIVLDGELGAGKTTFVQGVAEGLGITTAITSPTFTLVNLYPIDNHPPLQQLVHIDLYRVTSADSLANLDIPGYQADPGTIVLVEWYQRAPAFWKTAMGTITLTSSQLNHRTITVRGPITRWFRLES